MTSISQKVRPTLILGFIPDINHSNYAEALTSKIGTLSLEAQAKLEKETAKKEAKAEAKADAALKKKLASQVRRFFIPFTSLPH